jgi:Secretion system C-terminal sorting domain
MEKLKKLLLLSLFALVSRMHAQTGSSCATAIDITNFSSLNTITFPAGNTKWLYYGTGNFTIQFKKVSNPNLNFKKSTTYSENCNNLVLSKTDSNPNLDSSFRFRAIGNGRYIKVECLGNVNESIKLDIIPKSAPSPSCGMDPCELIDNGRFDYLSVCVTGCANGTSPTCGGGIPCCNGILCSSILGNEFGIPNFVPGWNDVNITPQILFNGTDAYAYMWTCNTTIYGPPASTLSESINNVLCSPVAPGITYSLKLDYAFVNYPTSNCASSGTAVDRLVAIFRNPQTGAAPQTVVLASNITNTAWTSNLGQLITFNAVYTEMEIRPENYLTEAVSAIKIDNISLKEQNLTLPSPICLSSSINLSNYNCLSGYTFNCPNAPSSISISNGNYIFTPTTASTYTINAVSPPPNSVTLSSTVTVVSSASCSVSFVSLPSIFCKNNINPFNLTNTVNPTGGVFSGSGISNSQFYPAATTSPTSTITYAYNCNNICKKIIFQNINIVSPTIIPINTPATICTKAAPINLLSYVSITNGTFTGNGVINNTFNPGLTNPGGGSYTLTYNYTDANGCSAASTKVIQVVLPTSGLTVASNPSQICNGTTATITVSGGTPPYIWSTGQTGNSITTNIAQYYSVYSITNGVCSGGDIIIGKGDPPPALVSGNSFACAGQNITLNVISPDPVNLPITNVYWNPNTGTCVSPCTSYTLPIPLVNTVYNIYPVTSNPINCIGNAAIQLYPVPATQPFCCSTADYVVPKGNFSATTNLSSFASGASFTNKIFNIPANTTLVIDYAVTFTTCTLRCGVNSKIITNNIADPISFTGCNFYACGDQVWNGIVLGNKTAAVNFTNCKIEDALVGVSIGDGNAAANFMGNTFNKNYRGVQITTSNRLSYTPVSFSGNQFTSVASTTSPNSYLKTDFSSYNAPRGIYGIYLLDAFPPATVLPIQMQIGNTGALNKNTFNNLDYGIYSFGVSKLKIINNDFINIGIGVSGNNEPSILYNGIVTPTEYVGWEIGGAAATKNTFTNNKTAILYNGGSASIVANTFNNPGAMPSNTAIAIIGIRDLRKFSINSNSISNYTAGIKFDFDKGIAFNASFVGGGINIDNNSINGAQSQYGIRLFNLGTNTPFGPLNPRPISMSSNNILAKNYGIHCLDIDNVLSANSNTITNNYVAGGTATAMIIYGCDKTTLNANTITSNTTSTTSFANLFGMSIVDSKQLNVQCNSISKSFIDLLITGNCVSPGLGIAYNKFLSGNYGFVLNANGEIGTQAYIDPASPTTFYSCENTWGAPTAFFNAQTATITTLSTNTNSKMYLRAAIKPTVNGIIGAPNGTTIAYGSTGLPTGLAPIICDPCSGIGCAAALVAAPTTATSTGNKLVAATAPIVNNTASYAVYDTEQKLRNKKAVYELIQQYPAMKNTAAFNAFSNTNKNTCIGKLTDVEDLMANANYSQAKILNNSFTATCSADADLQSYYDIYLKYVSDTVCCDSTQYFALFGLANHCPDKVGVIVYKARALYDNITKKTHQYTDNCNSASFVNNGGSRILNPSSNNGEVNTEEKSLQSENISLYPNPNNGNFIISINTSEKQSLEITILDLNGKIVFSQTCVSDNGKCEFNANQLQRGFYTVKINHEKSLKLLIK